MAAAASYRYPPALFDVWASYGTSLDQEVLDPREAIALVHEEVFDSPVLSKTINSDPLV